ncbi:MAG: NADP oxidoreductase, partial [candidate division WOR-3 bacterium]
MSIARMHVLIPFDPDTLLSGVKEFQKALLEEIKKRGLENEIKVLETGSIGVTGKGILMVVYPEGIIYANLKIADIPRIVEEHFIKGRAVKELLLGEVPARMVKKEKVGLVRQQKRVVLENAGVIDPENIEEYIAAHGYEALEKVLTSMKPEDVIEEIKKSG